MKKLLKKLFTIGKGKVHDELHSVVKSNEITLIEQQIRDAEEGISKYRDKLATAMAKEMTIKRKKELNEKKVKEFEGHIRELYNKTIDVEDNKKMANEIAIQVVSLEEQIAMQLETLEDIKSAIKEMDDLLSTATSTLTRKRVELEGIKVQEELHQASSEISEFAENSKIAEFSDSIDDVKNRHQEFRDKQNAMKKMKPLKHEIKSFEIDERVNSVLERVVKKTN